MSTIRSMHDDDTPATSSAAAVVAAVSGVLALATAVVGVWMLGH